MPTTPPPSFADPRFLSLESPLRHPLPFALLELVVLAAFVATLHHALSSLRRGDRYPLFQWLAAACYGVLMELIAFNYLNNYEHGRFTVQLYHGLLPLYVVCLYPVLHYTGVRTVERWNLGWVRGALLTGFAICLLDIPFDIAGPDAGWWRWADGDPNLRVRWLGVPVNSYYWYLLFGAGYATLCRALRPQVERRGLAFAVLLAPLVGVGIIALGTLLFQPLHLLKALLGPVDTLVVAAHLAGCALLLLFTAPRAPSLPDPRWQLVPPVFHAWHVGLIVAMALLGQAQDAPLKIAMALGAAVLSIALAFGWPAPLATRAS